MAGNQTTQMANAKEVLKEIEDGYSFVKLLGQGSVGTVYECKNHQGKHIAVKLMETNPMMDSEVFESIVVAALATQKIPESVNVVKVLSAGRKGPIYYIVMEMMEGGTLEQVVESESISFERKLQISGEIAHTLSEIHKRGIVHGDLKPENVLMSAKNRPYLNDFYLFPSRGASSMPSMPLGTPYYMSPEQAKGTLITTASDVYSFGIMIYELLTGKMPYLLEPDNIQGMVQEIIKGNLNPPSNSNPKVDNKLEAVILKLLEKNSSNRYHQMNIVAEDLFACLNKKTISIPYKLTLREQISSFFSKKK
jgi:serine/threonine protein kinase